VCTSRPSQAGQPRGKPSGEHFGKQTQSPVPMHAGRRQRTWHPASRATLALLLALWLNLIECAFSKMARTFLRHIRVKSKDELKTRILQGIAEINASPVVFRWNKFDLGVT
jgi:hypothetical protein